MGAHLWEGDRWSSGPGRVDLTRRWTPARAVDSPPSLTHHARSQVRARLRAVSDEAQLPLVCPPARLCVDNGVMVAWAGLERLALNVPEFLEPPPSLAQVRALCPSAPTCTLHSPHPTEQHK